MSSRLDGVHPDLVVRVGKILAAMDLLGLPMMVTDGVRTLERQQALYAQGRTAPGKVVTYADGLTRKSKHQSGQAVDCCFVVNGKPSWNPDLPWKLYGAMAQALGLVWGGSWGTMIDKPHIEWNGLAAR